MSVRLATSPTQPDQVFPGLDALAAHIHAWRRDRGVVLRQVQLARPGVDQEAGVSVYADDHDGERGDHLGYALLGCAAEIAVMRLSQALQRLRPAA